MEAKIDYKKILIAYILHVEKSEGVSCLYDLSSDEEVMPDLSAEERLALVQAYEETGLDC